MAQTTAATALVAEQWRKQFFKEYVRASQFQKSMGTSEQMPIQLIEDLTKKSGDKVTVNLVRRLTQAAILNNGTLEGSEESLANYGHQLTVNMRRNGVLVPKMEQIRTEMDLWDAAKSMLKYWAVEDLRDLIVAAMLSPVVDGKTAYADASEAQKDAWSVANSDRLLFGAAVANYTGDHSADILKVDATNDVLSTGVVSLAKRIAKTADPQIRPIKVDGQGEWYCLYANSLAFRDLKNATAMQTAQRDGWARGKSNPIFNDGDLLWDGVIVKEIPEIGVISGVGAAGIDVAPNFLCGAQAVGVAWGQRPMQKTEEFDYGSKMGCAIEQIMGVEKLMSNSVQNGMVTVYTAGVADA